MTQKSNKRKKEEEIPIQSNEILGNKNDKDDDDNDDYNTIIKDEEKVEIEILKKRFKDLYRLIKDEEEKIEFISFVCEQLNVNIEPIKAVTKETKQDSILQTIIQDLKDQLPSITTEAPNEKITIPKNTSFEGYTKENTINVDGFLYTEEDIDDLIESGELKNNYCLDCASKSIQPINFISHSTTPNQLKYMFSNDVLGGNCNLKQSTILDIGSRLGALLYTGYLFSDTKKLIGCEINQYFSDLQKSMINRYKMTDRIEIVHGNILDNRQLIQQSDIIYMNNVLEFFQQDKKKHIEFWQFIQNQSKSKKGLKILTIPSLEESFKNNKIPLKLKGWVKKIQLDSPVPQDDPTFPDYQEIHLYEVL
ncbi:hypothetical protein ACTFIY_000237 [Dictyostelium cf. discoideum]